jgi:hypothetical protein
MSSEKGNWDWATPSSDILQNPQKVPSEGFEGDMPSGIGAHSPGNETVTQLSENTCAPLPSVTRDQHGRFLTGNSGGGRPKGSRNKLTERFLDTIANDFSGHGAEAIANVRTTDPATYLKIAGSLIQRTILDMEYGPGFIGKVNASTNNYVNAMTIRFVKPEPNNNNVIENSIKNGDKNLSKKC